MNNKLLPQHVAIIMDGNGRWARKRGLPRLAGHKAGLNTVKKIVRSCAESGIKNLSLFAFSSENWSRPPTEVSFLMDLFLQSLTREVQELHSKGLRLRFIGDRSAFNPEFMQLMENAEELTAANTGMNIVIAINYGGQWDIVQATRTIAERVASGQLAISQINEMCFNSCLATKDLQVPDLFIRTSGEQRLSNFFLWQAAYSELYFCEEYWPDFDENSLAKAFQWFNERERRFGKTSEQLAEQNHA